MNELSVPPTAPQTADEILQGYAREVPLYRAGTAAGPRATAAELLAALPYITKLEIKQDFPHNFLRAGDTLDALVAAKRIEIEHTAGTTDNRADLILPYGWWATQERWALSLNAHVAQVLAENPEAHRVTISSPACNGDIRYNGTPSAKRRTLGLTRVLSLSRFPFLLSERDLDQQIAEAVEWDPVFLDTDPVYAVVFALHCERRGVKFPKLKFILTSYEYTSVLHKRILERAFGVPVYNLYGSTETGHLIMERTDGYMVASPRIAQLAVINEDARGIGELVVSTLTNDYMPLLNYRIGDLVERRTIHGANGTSETAYLLHGRNPDTIKAPDGRRITTRDVDQCFVGAEGLVHYRLHETTPGKFVLNYITETDAHRGSSDCRAGSPDPASTKDPLSSVSLTIVLEKLTQLLQPPQPITTQRVKFLLPEASGKFVFNYPFLAA